MNTPLIRLALAAGALTLLDPAVHGAGPEDDGAVVGSGSVVVKRDAQFLRVQVEVLARGKDLKEALARLKQRKEAARTQLVALGAARDAAEFGDVAVSAEAENQQANMERLLRERIRNGTKKPAEKEEGPPVTVSVPLKVDLPLKADGPEELLLASQALQEKIRAADLGGLKEVAKGTPKEEEAAEEAVGQRGENGTPRGEPVFLFVVRVSDEERDKALAEAFSKARKDAERLARAAGQGLGSLKQLTNLSPDGDDSAARYNAYLMRERGISVPVGDGQSGEAVGMQPTGITFRVAVSASFQLKAGK